MVEAEKVFRPSKAAINAQALWAFRKEPAGGAFLSSDHRLCNRAFALVKRAMS